MTIAYHASHEQFLPSELLHYVQLAEQAGFDAIHCSDHFHPWSIRQGNSGFSFSWIAAAMQVTKIPFSMVCAPGQRYHPAIVAQAVATIAEMFPGRYSVELGSGEALNEMITGDPWRSKEVRNERLLQCYHIIHDLLQGKEVSYNGHVKVKEAKLYTLPKVMPLLFCAAISKETSSWAGTWSDGLITTASDKGELSEKISAFQENGGQGKPIYAQFSFSFAATEEEAAIGAHHQWRTNLLPTEKLANLYKPLHFDDMANGISVEEVKEKIPLITSIEQLDSKIKELATIGINRLILHNVNRKQEEFIKTFKQLHPTKIHSLH